jgi:uracil phosphoribosyltransferase
MNGSASGGTFSRDPRFPNLIVTRHPLLRHKVTLLRKLDTPKKIFKELVDEIAMLLAYEVTSDLPTEEVRVETPLESMSGDVVIGERLTLVPILRAGLGMVDGVLNLIC